MKKLNYKYIFLIFLLFLIVPWSFGSIESDIKVEKITSDLRFYEINTCKIPLAKFLLNNFNVIYQDHYKININVYSSIQCYGKITGIDQINDVFYISVGANSLVNLMLYTLWYLFIISQLKNNSISELNPKKFILSSGLNSMLLVFGIYFQPRYYEKTLYLVDFDKYRHFIFLFFIFFTINIWSLYLFETRKNTFINFSPFIFLLIGVLQGFNLNFFIIFLANFGIFNFVTFAKKFKIFTSYYLFLIFIWFYTISIKTEIYFFKPDKILGLINSSSNSGSVLYWSFQTLFVIVGLYFICNTAKDSFNINLFSNNLLITSSLVVIMGVLSSHFPIVRFYNFLYFGQQKYSTDNQNIFSFNDWGELIAWRGFFPSAETAGELFALSIFVLFYQNFKHKNIKFTFLRLLSILLTLIGLLGSNNRSALITLILTILILLYFKNVFKISKNNQLLLMFVIFSFMFYYVASIKNFYPISYVSSIVIENAIKYSVENSYSSSLKFLLNSDSFLLNLINSIIGLIAFYINRSEIWGIFIARYNPNLLNLFFGSGPFHLTNLYSENPIKNVNGLILPHSSFLDMIVFFGILNFLIILIFFVRKIRNSILHKSFDIWFYISISIIINILKSDSILYSSSFIFYVICIFSFFQKKGLNKI